jgi:DNA polymerase III gamma/tau subunit
MRDILVVKSAGAKSGLLILTSEEREATVALAEKFDTAGLIYNITTLERLRWTIKNSDTPRALIEASLLRLALSEHFINIADLLKSGGGHSADIKKKSSPAGNVAAAQHPLSVAATQPRTTAEGGCATRKLDSIEAIKNNWQAVRSNMAASVSGLLASAVPTELKDSVLTLQFPATASIIMQMCQSNGKAEVIESALSKSIGIDVKIKYELGQAGPGTPAKPPGAKTSKKQMEDIANDPAVKTLLTGLGARITGIEETQ